MENGDLMSQNVSISTGDTAADRSNGTAYHDKECHISYPILSFLIAMSCTGREYLENKFAKPFLGFPDKLHVKPSIMDQPRFSISSHPGIPVNLWGPGTSSVILMINPPGRPLQLRGLPFFPRPPE